MNIDDKLKEIPVAAGYLDDMAIGRIKAVFASQRITLGQEAIDLLNFYKDATDFTPEAGYALERSVAKKILELYVSQIKGKV